ncbi:hypothetical protein [Helicobacter sp. T3_23-1056]
MRTNATLLKVAFAWQSIRLSYDKHSVIANKMSVSEFLRGNLFIANCHTKVSKQTKYPNLQQIYCLHSPHTPILTRTTHTHHTKI